MDPYAPQPTYENKSGRKKWIIIIILLLLIAGGAAAYFITKDDDNNSETESESTSQTSTTPTNTFEPAANTNQPYVATINTDANGKKQTATLTSDGQGNYSYKITANGQTITTVYTSDAYYLCQGTSKCIKYATTNLNKSGFDPSTYQYDTTKIDNLKNSANYKGQQSCPSGDGTCDVWSVSSGNTTSTVYINTTSKRIVSATNSSGTTQSDITYDYKNVDVIVPTDFTTVPTQ